jgi:pyruvyltransferase
MIQMGVPTHWHRSINFGDQLAPFIIKLMTGREAIYVNQGDGIKHIMPIGSLLDDANLSNSIVWGCGFGQAGSVATKPYKISAVRGKLSRAKYHHSGIDCPKVYGDPALLLGRLYPIDVKKKYKIGVAAHIIDYSKIFEKYALEDSILIIDFRKPVEDVILDIVSCDSIISSSLHGLIVAHAYNIPAAWCEFSDNVIGGGFKFRDYYSAFNIEMEPVNARELPPASEIKSECHTVKISSALLDLLIEKFPDVE